MQAPETYLWHVWPSRHWPSSASEEAQFVADLQSHAPELGAAKKVQFERGDLTTVLNALRNGMTYDELLTVAPGIVPARLLSAYRHLDSLRATSMTSFHTMCKSLTDASVLEHASQASKLLPVPSYRLIAIWAEHSEDAERLEEARAEVCGLVSSAGEMIKLQELQLTSGELDSVEAVRQGRVLYDPFGNGLWSHPYFLPYRIGVLVPSRVKDLLGEREE
jgi:hypothetical protein